MQGTGHSPNCSGEKILNSVRLKGEADDEDRC